MITKSIRATASLTGPVIPSSNTPSSFAYLYVCFGAIVLLKASVLHDISIGFAPWGYAAVKAFILGKFMLIGHDIRLGERFAGRPARSTPPIYR